MDHFELVSEYEPTGDQPQAIEKLTKGFQDGNQFETLLGGLVQVRHLQWRILYRI